jgi:hypothetical protein
MHYVIFTVIPRKKNSKGKEINHYKFSVKLIMTMFLEMVLDYGPQYKPPTSTTPCIRAPIFC